MKDEDTKHVSVNHCVSDSELAEADALCAAAEPGEWRVYNERVVRYGSEKSATEPGSLRLMARSRTLVPRLLKGIRVLEDALRSAWAEAASWKRTVLREREEHAADIERTRQGKTGPDDEIELLAQACELGVMRPDLLRRAIRAWASGVSIRGHYLYSFDVEDARRRVAETARIRAEIDCETQRERDEIRALLAELRLTKREREQIAGRVRKKVG